MSELARGKTAADLIAQAGRLPLAQALQLLKPACEALAAAHAKGVAHRKLTPASILVTDQGETKVLDLGVGQAAAPFGDDGPRADVHGLAACLYEMTTGTKPFGGDAGDGLAGLDYVPASKRSAGLPPELERLLDEALSPPPRPPIASMSAFLERLEAVAAGQPARPS